MNDEARTKPVEILLVEDNIHDVRLTREAFAGSNVANRISAVDKGEKALRFLKREGEFANAPRPELILLDLQLPGKDGREVLAEIKADPNLRRIPVIVLSNSQQEEDVLRAYNLNVNSYIRKPADLDEFAKVVKVVEDFWFKLVRLPPE